MSGFEDAPGSSSENATDPADTYQVVADKVGFVPNVRKSDNVLQARIVVASCLVGACAGFALAVVFAQPPYVHWAMLGLFVGLVLGTLGSGAYLMVRNLRR